MKIKQILFFAGLFIMMLVTPAHAEVKWNDWSDQLFEQAKKENKFVILDLEAVWCHWCHVMEKTTYHDEKVNALLNNHYIAVRVDQDARPDLSIRYRDYGWPATIIFAPDGTEIVKRSGYISPQNMSRLLQAIIDDPSPEQDDLAKPDFSKPLQSSLDNKLREELIKRHAETYDIKLGGLLNAQKFLDRDSVEYAMLRAGEGDAKEKQRAMQTLDAALKLFDPAWGGVYQYSTHGDWLHPHFEKIMAVQAGYFRLYSLAYAQFKEPRYLKAMEDIFRYTNNFLRDANGAFYTSQDADLIAGQHSDEFFALDDKHRRQLGIPRIDKHQYARENGWMIEALAIGYEATGDQRYLQTALKAANWIEHNRLQASGLYSHDKKDRAGPYLGDSLAMARAHLALYRATGNRVHLAYSERTTKAILGQFKHPQAGFYSAKPKANQPVKPIVQLDENMSVVRYLNLLAQTTGRPVYHQATRHVLKFLNHREIALSRITEAGILIIDMEINQPPLHVTVIGAKDNQTAQRLYNTALKQPGWYKRIEWWDTREGRLPNPDVQYPVLDRVAAFVCTDSRCSLPLFSEADLAIQFNK